MWATAWATTRSLVRGRSTPPAARVLLATGAVAVGASMVLAVWWAVGEATGLPHPGLDAMAATHGVANALGFVLCSLVAVRLVRRGARDDGAPALVPRAHDGGAVPPGAEEVA
ncbi:YndJ family transporter [Cellulosimicrobium sp. CUA-896]|uniref:YndJ family transporter n=1 Tax=Cellulosimicrobium sp. CUA-896 TaxID=1517881 RepID=UPI0035180F79